MGEKVNIAELVLIKCLKYLSCLVHTFRELANQIHNETSTGNPTASNITCDKHTTEISSNSKASGWCVDVNHVDLSHLVANKEFDASMSLQLLKHQKLHPALVYKLDSSSHGECGLNPTVDDIWRGLCSVQENGATRMQDLLALYYLL